MKAINPYLNFNGNAEEAFNFYKSVFGGEFATLMRLKDMPPPYPAAPDNEKEKIMHVTLPLGENQVLMGSDVPASLGKPVAGNNFHISVSGSSEEEAKRVFNALAEGGKITMPQEKTFWGALFGMCTDKFGISWMVSYEYK